MPRRAPLIDQSQTGCQSPQPRVTGDKQQLSMSVKVSALCVLIGNNLTLGIVIKMLIYKKLGQAVTKSACMVQAVWIYCCSSPASLNMRPDAAAQERLRCPTWTFVSHWELSTHSTLVHKAALRHVERLGYITVTDRTQTDVH